MCYTLFLEIMQLNLMNCGHAAVLVFVLVFLWPLVCDWMNKEILQYTTFWSFIKPFFKTFQTWPRYLGVIWYLELYHIVRVEAGSAYMTRPGRTTSWSGVKLNHLLPTTASKQVICFVMSRSQKSWKSILPSVYLYTGGQLIYQIPNNKVLTTKIGLLNSLREYDRVSSKVNYGRGNRL